MKFQHRPTTVDAERYNGPGSLSPEFAAAICQPPCEAGGVRYRNGEQLPHIDTNHGPVQLEAGWWVVRELDGSNWYPVAPDVFEASYELLPPEPPAPISGSGARCGEPFCDGDAGHDGKHYQWVPE